jgi:hypothetical protein
MEINIRSYFLQTRTRMYFNLFIFKKKIDLKTSLYINIKPKENESVQYL